MLTALACSSTATIETTTEGDRTFIESVTGAFKAPDGRVLIVCQDARSFCDEDPCKKAKCHDMLSGKVESFESDESNYTCDCYGCECTSVSEGVTLKLRTIVSGETREELRTVAMRSGYAADSIELARDYDGGTRLLFRGVRWERSQSASDVCPTQ